MSGVEVILVGAGQGRRMGAAVPKVFLPLGPRPVLAHAVAAFTRLEEVGGVVLVVPAGEEAHVREFCQELPGAGKIRAVIAGGEQRQDSVQAGLQRLRPETEVVLIHDGARPFVSAGIIRSVIDAARRTGAAVPGVPVADTLKQKGADQLVARTLPREQVVAVQTPQGFRRETLQQAYAWARAHGVYATDDAGLAEQAGLPVAVVPGDPANLKLTTPLDFQVAEAIWQSRT